MILPRIVHDLLELVLVSQLLPVTSAFLGIANEVALVLSILPLGRREAL